MGEADGVGGAESMSMRDDGGGGWGKRMDEYWGRGLIRHGDEHE